MLIYVCLLSPFVALIGIILWDAGEKRSDPSVGLTAVLALCTLASCIVAFLQWQTLEKTDDTYWAGQRPWLAVDAKPELSYFSTFDKGQTLSIGVHLPLSNSGNIPATSIRFASETSFTYSVDDPSDKFSSPRERICSGNSFEESEPSSIFPKQMTTLRFDASAAKPPSGAQAIHLTGCITYQFGERNGRTGHTYFVLHILANTLDLSPKDDGELPIPSVIGLSGIWAD